MLKSIPSSSLFIRYLGHRDVLTAQIARCGAGYVIESNIKEAKEELKNIQSIVEEIEERKNKSKNLLNCNSCYKK